MIALRSSRVLTITAARARSGWIDRSHSVLGSISRPKPQLGAPITITIIQPQQQQHQQHRNFGKKIVDIRRGEQREVWSAYLSGSISDSTLFSTIDLNKSNDISVDEINYFLDSVGRSGIDESKFDLLLRLGNDHLLDKEEFQRWLRMATDVKNDGTEFAISISESSSSSDSSDDDSNASSNSSSASPTKKKVVDARRGLQGMVWEIFLTTGTQASDLFKMIDLDRGGTISAKEIAYFIDSIGGKGVSQGKLNDLKTLGEDHQLTEEEFYDWLSDATGIELTEDGEKEPSSITRDSTNADGCTPGQW